MQQTNGMTPHWIHDRLVNCWTTVTFCYSAQKITIAINHCESSCGSSCFSLSSCFAHTSYCVICICVTLVGVQFAFQFLCLLFINDTNNMRTLHQPHNLEVKHAETIRRFVCLHQIESFSVEGLMRLQTGIKWWEQWKERERKKTDSLRRKFSQAAKSRTWTATIISGLKCTCRRKNSRFEFIREENS